MTGVDPDNFENFREEMTTETQICSCGHEKKDHYSFWKDGEQRFCDVLDCPCKKFKPKTIEQESVPPKRTPNIRGIFSTEDNSKFWLIPKEIYEPLDQEFHFDFDPCPYPYKRDGIDLDWGKVNWVNPPFRAKDAMNGNGPTAFVRKAIEEQKKGKTSVLILPVLGLLNMLFEAGAEIRSCGRVKWIHAETGEKWKAPSNCALFILHGDKQTERQRLKLEVSRVLDEEIKKEEDCLNKDNYEEQIDEHIFMIEMANRIKKRLGI